MRAEQSQNRTGLGVFYQLLQGFRALMVLGLLAMAGGSAVNLLLPEILRQLINGDFQSYIVNYAWQTGCFFVLLFAIQALCFYFRSYIFNVLGHRVVNNLRQDLYKKLITQPVSFFDQSRTGDLVSRIASDSQLIQEAISLRLSVLLRYSFQVFVGLILMCALSWKLTLAIVLVLPVLVTLSIVLGKKLKLISKQLQTALGLASNIAEETFSGIKIVKAFGKEEFEDNRFAKSVQTVLGFAIARSRVSAFFSSFVSFLMNVSIIGVLFLGFHLVYSSQMTFGDLTAFMLYGAIVAVSFSFVAASYSELMQALGAIDRVLDILGKEDCETVDQGTTIPKQANGEIVFTSVEFAYPARSSEVIINKVDFILSPKTITALVGPSGAGKSTLAALLLRFYQPLTGSIKFDGINLNEISKDWFYRKVAYVPQDPVLFAMSIRDNIKYAKPEASEEEVLQACKRAQVMQFAEKLSDGLDTICGERGHQLSGGERQRVAIARAILRQPLLLVLDEATAALDSNSETLVQAALEEVIRDCTTLVIAHRLATIKNADQVLVLENGKLKQSGTHASLSLEPGLYAELLEKQKVANT